MAALFSWGSRNQTRQRKLRRGPARLLRLNRMSQILAPGWAFVTQLTRQLNRGYPEGTSAQPGKWGRQGGGWGARVQVAAVTQSRVGQPGSREGDNFRMEGDRQREAHREARGKDSGRGHSAGQVRRRVGSRCVVGTGSPPLPKKGSWFPLVTRAPGSH